jgi:diguanylate cyclase (GGDEF)-like protein
MEILTLPTMRELLMESNERKLQKWLEFTQKIFSSLEMDQTARTIVDVALELMEMQRGFIAVVEPGSPTGRFVLGRSDQQRTLEEKDFEDAFNGFIHSCLMNPEIRSDNNHNELKVFIPLFSARKTIEPKTPIAYLYQERNHELTFDPAERELAEVFGLHAAMALENVRLYDTATRDQLTGLYLRHYFDAIALVEWKRTVRHGHPLSVIFLDIDNFKTVNELHGRSTGDSILQTTAGILKEACRTEDIISRYGGEEFIALLPETDETGVKTVAARIQEDVTLLLSTPDQKNVTVSIGAATYPRCAVNHVQNLIQLAEIARLRSFQLGGGRTIYYEPALSNVHVRLFQ